MEIQKLKTELRKSASNKTAKLLQRFFKTGAGEYGEGNLFIGVKVPATRKVAKAYVDLPLPKVKVLSRSPYHEERLCAFLILVFKYQRAAKNKNPKQAQTDKLKIYKCYLSSRKHLNSWDLIDITAPHIVGGQLWKSDRKLLFQLAKSSSLWDRRLALLSSFFFIRKNDFKTTLQLAALLMQDTEDLIHKAAGWMLREIGVRDRKSLVLFLGKHHQSMPRTMRFPYANIALTIFPNQLSIKATANPCQTSPHLSRSPHHSFGQFIFQAAGTET